ncbi:MAG TPA: 4-hydroxy-tetrahydrodipicolinate synthase [Bacteroidales bacterium]|nr:4-hydroxy-tetrahydrodipicolinate synthase [Bacteroidales bacterium]
MTKSIFKGTGVALATPFRNDGSIDFSALKKLVNHVIENGVDYLVVLGTTGETPVLSRDEKRALVDFVHEVNNGRCPVVMGIGGNDTTSVINSIRETDFQSIDAILSVAPYYNKPGQEGLYLHFRKIAEASPVPVILYNVPGRTGSNISADTTLRLAHDSSRQIIAVKEASGNFAQVTAILKDMPDSFMVISGDDAIALPLISLGASGVISVIANAYPGEFSKMIRLALGNNIEEAREIYYKLMPVFDMLFTEGNPAGLKAFLEVMGISQNHLRLPLVPVSDNLYEKIRQFVKAGQ